MVYFESPADETPIERGPDIRVLMGINGFVILLVGCMPSAVIVLCQQAFATL